MFDILHPDTMPRTPWKNGGGTTREIARAEQDGTLLWRLSLADVDSDGPFSLFAGLARILTVVTGQGIDLHFPQSVIRALPSQPVRFSGDLPVHGCLVSGPITDLNLIFDPTRITAEMTMVAGPLRIDAGRDKTGFLALAGQITVDNAPLPVAAYALGSTGMIALAAGATGLCVTLRPASH